MAPIGCALIKTFTDCILQECKFVILSTKPPLCIDEDFKVVDLFAKFIEAIVNCPDFSTALPKSLVVEEGNGYGTLEIIGVGIGCAVAGIGVGLALRSGYRFLARIFGRYFRRTQSITSAESTRTVFTVVDDVPGIPNYEMDEFMEMTAADERPSSSCYPQAYEHDTMTTTRSVPVLPIPPPIILNPLYQTRSSSEVSIHNRVDKKTR